MLSYVAQKRIIAQKLYLLSHPGGGRFWVGSGLTLMVGRRKVEHSSNGEPDNLKVNFAGFGSKEKTDWTTAE